MGRALGNHLLNLQLRDGTVAAMQQHALNLEEIESKEEDAGLGNGGIEAWHKRRLLHFKQRRGITVN